MSDPVVPAASAVPATGGAGPLAPLARDGTATVPDVSADLYRAVVEFAASTPSAVRVFAVIFTEAGVVALGLLMVLRWWRARGEDDRWAALAVLAPAVTVLAYLVSETAKSALRQDRPCQAMPDVTALAGCPPAGDWSFPSNHATIAGAAAVAVLLSHAVREGPRRTSAAARFQVGPTAVALGAAVALSRVFVGVHYPHDVLTGFLLGAAVAAGAMTACAGPAASAVGRLRRHPTPRAVLGAGSTPADQDTGHAAGEGGQLRDHAHTRSRPRPHEDVVAGGAADLPGDEERPTEVLDEVRAAPPAHVAPSGVRRAPRRDPSGSDAPTEQHTVVHDSAPGGPAGASTGAGAGAGEPTRPLPRSPHWPPEHRPVSRPGADRPPRPPHDRRGPPRS